MHHFWLRAEAKANEHRTPLVPEHAAELVNLGHRVTVEESSQRIFSNQSYSDVGCELAPKNSWQQAPLNAYVLGLKEIPDDIRQLPQKHIMFGHLFKQQEGWEHGLHRFSNNRGVLLDLEYLTSADGRRVAAFGYWAGFAGAALAIKQWIGRKVEGENYQLGATEPYDDQDRLITSLRSAMTTNIAPRILVIGSLGRCGRGAIDLCKSIEISPDGWDIEETSRGGPFDAILNYDILINCVLLGSNTPPFLTWDQVDTCSRKLTIISDVSCDPNNPGNPLPIYKQTTDFEKPVLRLSLTGPALDIIAVDHLPSLLPKESSSDFSQQLLPYLKHIDLNHGIWKRCLDTFHHHCTLL